MWIQTGKIGAYLGIVFGVVFIVPIMFTFNPVIGVGYIISSLITLRGFSFLEKGLIKEGYLYIALSTIGMWFSFRSPTIALIIILLSTLLNFFTTENEVGALGKLIAKHKVVITILLIFVFLLVGILSFLY